MMPFPSNQLLDVLTALGREPGSLLVVGDVDSAIDGAEHRSEDDLRSSGDHGRKFSVGIAIDPLASDTLAYMRDIACKSSIAIQRQVGFTASEFLALGFQLEELNGDRAFSVWVSTPEVTDRPREWNNPDHWAHPENFDKQR